MRKLKLSLEDLTVSTFETVQAPEGRPGTVKANGYIPVQETNTCETAAASCYNTQCANWFDSCQPSCNCVSPSGQLCPTDIRCVYY